MMMRILLAETVFVLHHYSLVYEINYIGKFCVLFFVLCFVPSKYEFQVWHITIII